MKAEGRWILGNLEWQKPPIPGDYLSLRQLTIKQVRIVRSWVMLATNPRLTSPVDTSVLQNVLAIGAHICGKDFCPAVGWGRPLEGQILSRTISSW